MTRLLFDVRRVDDAWEVQTDNALPDDLPARFATQADAVATATTLARAVWRGTRRQTGVRLLLDDEDWRDVLRCGDDEVDC